MPSNKKCYVGIDPGQKGYIAILPGSGQPKLIPIPTQTVVINDKKKVDIDPQALYGILTYNIPDGAVICIEKQWGRPGRDVKGIFKLGENWGILRTCLSLFGKKWHEVDPKKWQAAVRDIYLSQTEARDKDLSIWAAKKLFPKLTLPKIGNKVDDNAADALLIGYYAKKQLRKLNKAQ